MKHVVLLLVALLVLLFGLWVASPAVAQPYNWTGIYIGAHAGGTGARHEVKDAGSSVAGLHYNSANEKIEDSSSGFIGGVQAGYNHQISLFVPGTELDLGYLGFHGSKVSSAVFNPQQDTFAKSSGGLYGTVTGRLGFAIDRILLYGKGGLSYGRFNLGVRDTNPIGLTIDARKRETRAGWTAGAGAEYAFLGNWTVKAEYLFMDFGTTKIGGVANNGIEFSWRNNLTVHTGKLGINYKF